MATVGTSERISKYVDLLGHPTYVDIDGSAPATVVMMHGLGGSTNYFEPLICRLSPHLRIIRFDFKGLGRTGPDPNRKRRITIPAYVEDLAALLELEHLDKVILIGHSLGSVVAMHFAAKYPSQVAGLVAIGPGRSRANIPAAKAFTLGMAKTAREQGLWAMADATVAKNVAPSSSDLVRAFVREVVAAQSGEGYAQVCEAVCDDTHVDPDYAQIRCRTVVVAGDQDLIAPLEQVKSIQQQIPRSILWTVRSGHQHVLEDIEGVLAGVEKVLDNVLGGKVLQIGKRSTDT